MRSACRIVLVMAAGLASASQGMGQERFQKQLQDLLNQPMNRPKAQIELRWVEAKFIPGVTEAEGFQSSCDPKSIVYLHSKPALVLTSAEVAATDLTHHDFSRSGLSSENYMVTVHLTKEARETLLAACDDHEMRLLTLLVDGRHWGVSRYEPDPGKPFVPDQARAKTFTPQVGFFSSRTEAERLSNAFTKAERSKAAGLKADPGRE